MSLITAATNRSPNRPRKARTLFTDIHVRLAPAELDIVEDLARELGTQIAPTARLLIGLGIEARRKPAQPPPTPADSQPPTEMLLHLLVASEQVLALIESFLPEGPGAADAALPAAAFAAQRRLATSEQARTGMEAI